MRSFFVYDRRRIMKRITVQLSTLLLAAACVSPTFVAQAKSGKFSLPVNTAPSTAVVLPVARNADVLAATEIKSTPGIAGLTKYPRVNGSTSTIPIGQLLLAKALGLDAELRRVPVERSWNQDDPRALTATFAVDANPAVMDEYSQLIRRQKHGQTHGAFEALVRGNSDLILVAREPSADEIALATQAKVTFDVRPVALDAFIFVANSKNEIKGLTLDEIRGIYSGEIKNWKEIGGRDGEIFAITRDENSGSQELMKKMVMADRPVVRGYNRMASTMGGTFDYVTRREDSIAYSVFYYERMMNPLATIKPLAINGVLPTSQTIADRTYPLVEPVYVVTRKDIMPDGPAATLRDWLLSGEGQKLIAQSGYVPLPPGNF